ncbi:hypothetical protein [Dokdonella sp.]|uniref:hypothetical protein n=1 Tax=Dokdonella sp. TaxID=2291710 RepID=UPI003C64E734
MNLSIEQRETLGRWLPTLIAAAAIWLIARGLGKLFHAVGFGLVWVYFWTQGVPSFLH